MSITRRHLRVSLAALWLLDGALQCQPFMFSRDFARRVLLPASQGQPTILAGPLHLVVALVSSSPALVNTGAVIIQIFLGLGLLSRRLTRVALGASLAWALSVWVVGEGLGGITTGATILSGAPGAALLYAVIAILAWPIGTAHDDDSPSWLALPVWSTLWLVGAGLQLVGANNSATSLSVMLRSAQSGSPQWIAGIDRHLAALPLPSWSAAVVVALDVLVSMWALVPGWTRQLSLVIGAVIAMTGWLLFQGLGDLTSGRSTDLNTGPLIVLLALAGAGAAHSRPVAQRLPATFASDDSTMSAGLAHNAR